MSSIIFICIFALVSLRCLVADEANFANSTTSIMTNSSNTTSKSIIESVLSKYNLSLYSQQVKLKRFDNFITFTFE